jgi:hypothetical protein
LVSVGAALAASAALTPIVVLSACAPSSSAQSGFDPKDSGLESSSERPVSEQAREIRHRLTVLSRKLTPTGLYYDDHVRSSIDAMPREVVEQIVPQAGYADEDANRESGLKCQVDDLYGEVSGCARSFVNAVKAYAAFAHSKQEELATPPEWRESKGTISILFDAHFYELEFRRSDQTLTAIRYRRLEQ